MEHNVKLKRLLEPIQIGRLTLKNRMVKAAYATFVIDNKGGLVSGISDPLKSHIETIAKAGIGLLITESCGIDYPLALSGRLRGRFHITKDEFIPEISELPKLVHKYDCPIFLQLHHTGPSFSTKERYGPLSAESKLGMSGDEGFEKLQPVAASSLSESEKPIALQMLPRGLTIPEIQDLVDKFAKGAVRAQKAGFDGVELHFAHSYLVNSFLSRVWNKRQDVYGCQSLENRARFGLEILRAVKERCGRDFPVGVRINGKEWGAKNATTGEDSIGFAKLFAEAGADYIHVTGEGYGFGHRMFWMFPDFGPYPEPSEDVLELLKNNKKPGTMVPYAAAIKKAISIPVIVVNNLTPQLGEWIIKNGKADLIAFARRLIADPELPQKVATGRLEDIAPCTRCHTCYSASLIGKPLSCRVNASLGREWEYAIKPAEKRKKVLIVGGGPAGMEAARVAALRGHEVMLYEREPELHGLLNLAATVKGVEDEDLPALIRYLKRQVEKVGVRVNYGQEVNTALIEKVNPQVVVLATGGKPAVPEIAGIKNPLVLDSSQLHDKVKMFSRFLAPETMHWLTKFWMPIGKSVVIIGGLIQGCQLAEFLVKRGRKVAVTEESDQLGTGMPEVKRIRLTNWLAEKGVILLTGVRYEEINDNGLTLISKNGERQRIQADTILVAMPFKPNNELFKALEGKVPEIYMIGDCRNPGTIVDAIAEGSSIGRNI
jgi:2,4-dienoyl-CoA reductase (NADPH2)